MPRPAQAPDGDPDPGLLTNLLEDIVNPTVAGGAPNNALAWDIARSGVVMSELFPNLARCADDQLSIGSAGKEEGNFWKKARKFTRRRNVRGIARACVLVMALSPITEFEILTMPAPRPTRPRKSW